MKRLSVLLILSLLAAIPHAKAEPGFVFTQTVKAAPEAFEGKEVGPFGVRFVAEPKWRFFPQPTIPKVLKKEQKEGYVRAALLVGKDGAVKDVKILEAQPEGQVEKEALAFFRRVVYMSDKAGEFETDAVLLFRKIEKKKKG